jgi:hypothetical protein
MAALKAHKVVAALPVPLEADSLYCVRAGAGFDLYVTNGAGQTTAYALNASEALPPWQTATLDLATPAERKSVFVAVAGMVATQSVDVQRSAIPAPGKGSDEHLAEPAVLQAFAWTDGFWLLVMAQGCTVGGQMTINYRVT